MARVNNLTNFLNDVATAIKQKLGDNTPIPASQFDTKIGEIETGGNYQTKSISITTNGNYTQLPDTGFDAMDQVVISVNVHQTGGDVKLFETIADMQADTDPQEGDLAIVYRNDTTIPSPGDTINSFSPPATVVFDTPITNSTSLEMDGGNCILFCELDATSYTMRDVFGMIIQDIITYESSDGITYTRTDGGAESYDLSDEEVVVPSNADINILKFLSTGGMVFEGLYEYKTNQYVIADSQLTLLADKLLPDIIGYGKNGITVGNFGANVSTAFNDDVAKIYTKAQIVYNNITPLVASDNNKRAGLSSDIVLIPCKSDGTSLLDTSNVTNMYNMFAWCSNLTLIPLLDTSKVTNMSQMFYECTSLRMIPVLNTSNVTNMMGTFIRCTSMTYIPLLDTSNVTSMTSTFADCTSLTTIPLLDTGSVTTMYNCFLRLYIFNIYTPIRYK